MKTIRIIAIVLMASVAMFSSKEINAQIYTGAKVNILLTNLPPSSGNPQTVWDGTAYLYLVNAGITVTQAIHVPVVGNYAFYVRIPMYAYTGEIQVRIDLGYSYRIYWQGLAKAVGTWSVAFEHTPIVVSTWKPI